MIDVTNVNMVEFVKKAYELSRPQGMGMMHFKPGPLSDAAAQELIQEDGTASMDYVLGRACKMHVHNRDGRLMINDSWFDHSDAQFDELLEHVGITPKAGSAVSDHGPACNCDDCRIKHGRGKLNPQKDFEKAKKAHEDGTAFQIMKLDSKTGKMTEL